MKNQRPIRRENTRPDAASQLRSVSPRQKGKPTKNETVSDLPKGKSDTVSSLKGAQNDTVSFLNKLKSETVSHLQPEGPPVTTYKPIDRTMRLVTNIPGSYLSTEWQDVWLVRFMFATLEEVGPWRWSSVIQRVAKTESPEYVQRISLGIMEMVLMSTKLEGEFEYAMDTYDNPLEQTSDFRKSGLANWDLSPFRSLMFEFCCTLYDVREAICEEIEAGGKDWDAASADMQTDSPHLKLAELLMIAELWMQRESFETDLGEGLRQWDATPTRIEALSRRLRLSLYADAFNVLAGKVGSQGLAA